MCSNDNINSNNNIKDDISYIDIDEWMSRCEYLVKGWYRHILAEVTFFLAEVMFFPQSFGSKSHAGVTNEQDCNFDFEGEGGTVAHAYYPEDGRVHFDNDERYAYIGGTSEWWWSTQILESLSYVALHEFSHTLGLGHSILAQEIPAYIRKTSTAYSRFMVSKC